MSDPSRGDVTPIGVEQARVADVNVSQFTVDVYTEETYRKLFDVPFSVPYLDANWGTGIQYMPEAGTLCWVIWPDQIGASPFVLGWCGPLDTAGGYKGLRRPLEPGDCIMETPDENYVWIRRGGIIDIASTPMCRRMYIPIDNLIRDVAGSYRMQTLGGSMDWSVSREGETDTDGHRQVRYAVGVKEFADDKNVMVSLQMSGAVGTNSSAGLTPSGVLPSNSDEDHGMIRLVVFDTGAKGETQKQQITIEFFKDGTMDLTLEKDLTISVRENIALRALEGDVEVTAAEGKVKVEASKSDMALLAMKGSLEVNGQTLKLSSTKGTTMDGGPIEVKTTMAVKGAGGSPTGVLLDTFLAIFDSHTHNYTAPAAATVTPLPLASPQRTTLVSQALTAAPIT